MTPSVVVTGRGAVTSIGEGADAFFEALLAKTSGVADGIAACADFEPDSAMTAKEARRSDRFTQLAVAAAAQATEEAGVPDGVDPQRLGAHGPGFSVSSACATGGHAIGEAMRMIHRGEADVVVAGGTEAALTGLCLAAFKRMGALSREGVSRPFDAERDGFVMGEGAAILVLEREEHARARGAKVFGRIVGYGASNDAFHMTQPDEQGRGATAAMKGALADADASPTDVGYINAHGTSTPFNDKIESLAIRGVFNGANTPPPVSSTKSHIGHLLGAAGAVEALVCLEAVRRGVLPPTINYETPDPECDLDYVPEGPREAPGLEVAISNSFGFGGQNACLAVGRA